MKVRNAPKNNNTTSLKLQNDERFQHSAMKESHGNSLQNDEVRNEIPIA